ncbi:MAG: helix-turn-helix domain-containing protein, partial [Nanoarchaeota archaeon]|nr:helix-turn-helix domain-containing protein [Nanoarchaeota archaeon]
MTTTYKFRLYPKKEQLDKLDLSLEICRQTYNNLLAGLDERYTKNELQNYLLDLKVVNPEMNNVYSKVLQMENQRLFSNLSSLSQRKKQGNKVGRL